MPIQTSHIRYADTAKFSPLVIDFLEEKETLTPFLQDFPSADAIQKQIERRKLSPVNRAALQSVIREQYQELSLSEAQQKNIDKLLHENTFTLCSAHQPVIFGGPLYIIYKIIHAIKLSQYCEQHFPNEQFVPVFYIGSEDNDLDEIGSFRFGTKQFHWDTHQKGPCGRMQTEGLAQIAKEIKQRLNEQIPDEQRLIEILDQAYDGKRTLSEATRILMHELFSQFGLLVLDADHHTLKSIFKPVIRQEILQSTAYEQVMLTLQQWPSSYKAQATPRHINFFYVQDQLRERIEKQGDNWQVLHTEITFTQQEIETEIENYPERFSPNVILRPLYQEMILPNIVFIGGGGELAYWLELKGVFDLYHHPFPLLMLRNSVLWIDKLTGQQVDKVGYPMETLFKKADDIFRDKSSKEGLFASNEERLQQIEKIYADMIVEAEKSGINMGKSLQAHVARIERIHASIREKGLRENKRKELDFMNRIHNIQQHLMPDASLQERAESFITPFKTFGFSMFDILLDKQEPFNPGLLVIRDL